MSVAAMNANIFCPAIYQASTQLEFIAPWPSADIELTL
jgi:hypothetical protein